MDAQLKGMQSRRIAKLSARHSYALLALAESLAVLWCLFLGLNYSSGYAVENLFGHLLCFECVIFVLAVFVSMAAMGLYHARLRGVPSEVAARIFLSFVIASISQAVVFYFVPAMHVEPKAIIPALGSSFVMVCLLRYCFLKIHGSSLLKRRVLVLGAGERALVIQNRMRRNADRQGFQLLGFVHMDDDDDAVDRRQLLNIDMEGLTRFVREKRVDELVIAADQRRGNLPMDALYRCRIAGVRSLDVASFIERESGKIHLHKLRPSWLIYGDGYPGSSLLTRGTKRVFDLCISLLLMSLIWPVMLVTALLISMESRGPILYTQRRVGLYGEPFNIYKFRSMKVDAEADGAVWARKNDQRVTAVGAFIRRYRIDELPQLFNILRGEMSFIGPRPERPEFVERLSKVIPYYGDRHQVKPGLTGWAQICYAYGGSEEDAQEKLQYDLYYIKNFSFLLDTSILVQTAEVVFFGKGVR